jgi:hypothetical protein
MIGVYDLHRVIGAAFRHVAGNAIRLTVLAPALRMSYPIT